MSDAAICGGEIAGESSGGKTSALRQLIVATRAEGLEPFWPFHIQDARSSHASTAPTAEPTH